MPQGGDALSDVSLDSGSGKSVLSSRSSRPNPLCTASEREPAHSDNRSLRVTLPAPGTAPRVQVETTSRRRMGHFGPRAVRVRPGPPVRVSTAVGPARPWPADAPSPLRWEPAGDSARPGRRCQSRSRTRRDSCSPSPSAMSAPPPVRDSGLRLTGLRSVSPVGPSAAADSV